MKKEEREARLKTINKMESIEESAEGDTEEVDPAKVARVVAAKPLNSLVDAALAVERLRVSTQIRQSHLKLQSRQDPETDALLVELVKLEEFIDGRVATLVKGHPAYPWFHRVKGIGNENIAKVIGLVDIERATTISGLWKFAGFAVEDGHAPKKTKGEKLSYNSRLRSMSWRLGGSLLKGKGCFYDYYLAQKERYTQRFQNQGYAIVPAAQLPKVDGKKQETDKFISEGHIHNMALRKTIKLFLSCLWLTWREAEGLPVTMPYAIDQLKHEHFLDPWKMVDRENKP